MKRKLLLFFIVSIAGSFCLDASSGAQPIFVEKKKTDENQDLQTRAVTGAPASSTGAAIAGINYGRTAFVSQSTMLLPMTYLGAAANLTDATAAPFAFARAFVDSAGKVHVDALADKARLNGEDDKTPLLGTAIRDLSLMPGSVRFGSLPVLLAHDSSNANDPGTIYLVTDPQPGMVTVLSNESASIKDAAGNEVNRPIPAIAASSQCIFAAVPQVGRTFATESPTDGTNRGIAVLTADGNKLKVLDATNFAGTTAKAQKLDVAVNMGPIAFVDAGETAPITKATIGSGVDMFYDPVLNRVYIAMSQVKRFEGTTLKQGGVLGIVVGCLESDKLSLGSVINGVNKNLFTANGTSSIVGFYFTNNTDASVSIQKPRVMHTSTGKSYLIVRSTLQATSGVFALPLIGNAEGVAAELVGTIAAVDADGVSKGDNKAPAMASELISATQEPAKIDKDLPACSPSITDLKDIYIEGDSVFLAYGGTAKSASAGIYRSTALFNAVGAIKGWTPLTRVSGDVRRSIGVGVDNQTGNIHFVTPATQGSTDTDFNTVDTDFNTVRVTQWGKSDDIAKVGDTQTLNNLTSLLNEIFPEETCRVHQLGAFDEFTPGFKTCNFSMMVALGKDTVALIQTGKLDADGNFLPVQEFKLNENVFVFKGGVLDEIGPLSCCELSRINSTNSEGWLFVGGYRGVAVLRAADGSGFNSDTGNSNGLANFDPSVFPGTGFSFRKLAPSNNTESAFWNVRGLCAGGGKLIIETQKSIFSVTLTADKFKDASPDALAEASIAVIPELSAECFSDIVFLNGTNETLIVATTAGLFVATGDGSSWVEVKVDNQSLGPVVQLQYLSQTKGVNSEKGNLYVLTGDISTGMGKVYRFDVDGSAALADRVKPIVLPVLGAFMNFGEFRGNFITDGAGFFHSLSKHLLQTRFLEVHPIAAPGSKVNVTSLLNVDSAKEFNTGVMIQEPAFGAWVFPGDWGVRVNQ